MAAPAGIEKKIDPGKPLDRDIYEMTEEELKEVPKTPGSLEEALNALKADHDFLLKGGVFTPDVIEAWVNWKQEKELDEMHKRPHPYEFHLYYDS
jgi:glutamine synthetase